MFLATDIERHDGHAVRILRANRSHRILRRKENSLGRRRYNVCGAVAEGDGRQNTGRMIGSCSIRAQGCGKMTAREINRDSSWKVDVGDNKIPEFDIGIARVRDRNPIAEGRAVFVPIRIYRCRARGKLLCIEVRIECLAGARAVQTHNLLVNHDARDAWNDRHRVLTGPRTAFSSDVIVQHEA